MPLSFARNNKKVSAVLICLLLTQASGMLLKTLQPQVYSAARAQAPAADGVAARHAPPIDQVSFAGRYSPKAPELAEIVQALQGWPDNPDVYAPVYLPDSFLEETYRQVMEGQAQLHRVAADILAQPKLKAMNTHLLLLGKPLYTPEKAKAEALEYVRAIQETIPQLDRELAQRHGFTPREISLMHRFMAKTAPILFQMGYPDAVRHASQVTRLCVIQAERQKASHAELLQAAMVGWLHDPKLAVELSRENLATHPVIGSAIARHVFADPQFGDELKAVLAGRAMTPEAFEAGVVEALSINNDSRYVLTEVIMQAIRPHLSHFPQVQRLLLRRFSAPFRGTRPPVISTRIRRDLEREQVASGLRGISLSAMEGIRAELASRYPQIAPLSARELLDDIVQNQPMAGIPEPERLKLVADLQARLQATPHARVENRINAINLFSHHQEVKNGTVAALALASSDPLLLSPHKIIEAERHNSCLFAIRSFLQSFNNNIVYVPRESRDGAQKWQRDLYKEMLRVAEELTGKRLMPNLSPRTSTRRQITTLLTVLRKDTTWQTPDGTDYGAASLENPATHAQAQRLLDTMKRHYDQVAESSLALFGTVRAANPTK